MWFRRYSKQFLSIKSKIYNKLIKIVFICLSVLAANGVISADFVLFELTVGALFISFLMVSSSEYGYVASLI